MAKRKIRIGKQEPSRPKVVQAVHPRTVEQLLSSGSGAELTISDEEIVLLVDEATKLDAEKKSAEKKVKRAKEILLASAKAGEWKERMGTSAVCKIGQSSISEVGTTTEFVRLLAKEGKKHLFDELTKVQIGDAKKSLGTDALEADGFLSVRIVQYGTVTLKSL